MTFQALTDAGVAYYKKHDAEVDKNLEALKIVRQLTTTIKFPLAADLFVEVAFHGVAPTHESYEKLIVLLELAQPKKEQPNERA